MHERIRNARKIRRITIQTDADGVSEWNALKEAAIRELEQNPSLFVAWLFDAMRNYSPKRWLENMAANKEEQADEDFEMGRDAQE